MLHYHRGAVVLASLFAVCLLPSPARAQGPVPSERQRVEGPVPSERQRVEGWASLGDMPAPVRSGNTVTFHNNQGIVAVTAVSPEIVRVRFSPGRSLGRDHSYAIVSKDFGDPRATFQVTAAATTMMTPALR